jgi:hypothetical protein
MKNSHCLWHIALGLFVVLLLFSAAIIPGCKKAPDHTKAPEYNPKINRQNCIRLITVLSVLERYATTAETGEGTEINKVYVTHDTKKS